MNMTANPSENDQPQKNQGVNTTPVVAQPDAAAPVLQKAPCPYVGPRSFLAGERLYGRERETGSLLNLLIAERIVLLYSPSGAGKSSLLNAALLPGLQKQNFQVQSTIRVNHEPPDEVTGVQELNRYVLSALLSLEEGYPADQRYPILSLASSTLDDYLKRRCEEGEQAGKDMSSIVLVFDQFEEVLTIDPTNRDAKIAFFVQVGNALRDPSRWALFSMREDYIAALDPFLRPIPTRLNNRFRLDLLEVDGAMKAIREPVRTVGGNFEENAARKLVDDLRRVKIQQADGSLEEMPGLYVEPVQLQVVCSRLWQKLPEGNMGNITLKEIENIGDANQALGSYYDSQVTAVVQAKGVSERTVRKWFDTRLITVQGIRGQVPLGQDVTDGLENEAVAAFERSYLIRSEKRGGTTWFELAHDRLIQPVRESNASWFSQNLVALQRQAEVWAEHSRPEGMLLSGKALDEAEAWALEHNDEMNDMERAFLEEALKVREGVKRERRYNRRIRRLGIAATIIGAIALVVAIAAIFLFVEANHQRQIATAREISFASISNLTVDPERSMLLGLAAINETGDPENAVPSAIEALHRSFQANRLVVTLHGHNDRVYAVAYSPDGSHVATGSRDGTALIWDATVQIGSTAAHKPLITIKDERGFPISDVAYSPDGKWLATSSWDGSVRVWDASNGSQVIKFDVNGGKAWTVAFSPVKEDGLLAAGFDDGKVRVWSMKTKGLLLTLDTGSLDAAVESVAFSPDGKTLGAGSDSKNGYVWQAATGKQLFQLTGHTDKVNSIDFSPDGKLIATASADRTERIYDAQNGELIRSLEGHFDWVYRAVFTADSQSLVTSSSDRSVRIWNVSTGVEVLRLMGHASQVFDVSVSPDHKHIASASQDQTARIWDITPSGSHELYTFTSQDRIYSMALTSDGKQLAAGLGGKGVEIWKPYPVSAQPELTITNGMTGIVEGLAYSPDDRYLAGVSRDGQLAVWDAKSNYNNVWQEKVDGRVFWTVAFVPGGPSGGPLRLITGGDGVLRLWEWDGNTARVIREMPAPSAVEKGAMILSVAVYPGKQGETWRTVAAAGYEGGAAVIWDLDKGQPIITLSDHSETVEGVAFSPDGNLFASIAEDGVVNLYRMNLPGGSAERLAKLENHAGALYAIGFSPDSKLLATAGADLTTRLWNTETRQETLALYGHTDRVYALQFGTDSQTLMTAGRDHTIRGYALDPNKLVTLATSRISRSLTPQECQVYLGLNPCPK
jgi:WD40 repeat protein